MGTFLKVIGIIVLAIGIIFTVTVLGAVVGISMILNGVILFALGSIYDDVREIKGKIK
ncbi:MAG: DUF5362 family protein [Candidatus Atribacteria bacterium]|nr:DUF5362 family protein [Candidatus Atribacteria bacterium]